VLVLSAAFFHFSYVTADPDLWGHIRFGQAHWENGYLDQVDPYSFTADGREWINHEWLAELLFYFLFYLFSDTGLLVGKLFGGLAVVLMLLALCRTRGALPPVTAIVLVTVIWAIKPGFMIRPQLFSFLFFTAYLLILYLFIEKQRNILMGLPLMMVLWVNLHGGFLMGCVVVAMAVGCETLAHFYQEKRSRRLKQLWGWAVVTAIAVFVNPYGYRLILFLYRSLSQPREITEWLPVTLMDTSYIHFKLVAVAVLVTVILRGKSNRGWEIAILLFTGFFALRHQRNIVFFALAAAPYLADGISRVATEFSKAVRLPSLSDTARALIGFVFMTVAAWHVYSGSRIYAGSGLGIVVDPGKYPVAAVEFIRKNRLRGNLFVHFDWGEYAIWKLHPVCRVSIDGRFRTVYPESVLRDHFIPANEIKKLSTALEKYPADILLYPRSPFTLALLKAGGRWAYVYSDALAFVFLRQNNKNRELLDHFKKNGFKDPILKDSYAFP